MLRYNNNMAVGSQYVVCDVDEAAGCSRTNINLNFDVSRTIQNIIKFLF